jgi:hypothetical protein
MEWRQIIENVGYEVFTKGLMGAFVSLLLVIGENSDRVYVANSYGLSPSNSGAENTAAFEALVDSIPPSQKAVIRFASGQTYEFASNGLSPINTGRNHCCLLKNWIGLDSVGTRATLKIADNQNTNATRIDLIVAGSKSHRVRISNLILDGNAANQSGYTNGYTQGITGGSCCLNVGNDMIGNPSICPLVELSGVKFQNSWGLNCSTHKATRIVGTNIEAESGGENIQFNYSDSVYLNGVTIDTSHEGDALEIFNGLDAFVQNAHITNSSASAIDTSGLSITIVNSTCEDCVQGFNAQCDRAQPAEVNPGKVLFKNLTVTNCGSSGLSFLTNGTNTTRVLNGFAENCMIKGGTVGINVSPITGAVDTLGSVTINNCTVTGVTKSGIIADNARVTVIGGTYSGNREGVLAIAEVADELDLHFSDDDPPNFDGNTQYGIRVSTATTPVPYSIQGTFYANTNPGVGTGNNQGAQVKPFNTAGMAFIYVVNTRPACIPTALRDNWPITGDTRVIWSHTTLNRLRNACDGQTIVIDFENNCTVKHFTTAAGNFALIGEADRAISSGSSMTFVYDLATDKFIEQ